MYFLWHPLLESSAQIQSSGTTNYSITASSGSYNYTGQSVSISRNKYFVTSAGSYSYTGSPISVSRNKKLTVSSGSYSCTGNSVTITKTSTVIDYSIIASNASYSYTGSTSVINKNRYLNTGYSPLYSTTVLAKNPTGYWKLNEIGGDTA